MPRLVAIAPLLLVAAGACDPRPFEPCGLLYPWEPGDFMMSEQGPVLSCARFPSLCDLPVASDVAEPDLALAIDVVFVSEGFTETTLPAYRRKVDELVAGLRADRGGIVDRDPALFNFHRVDVVAARDDLYDAERRDTPLGGCFHEDPLSKDFLLHAEGWLVQTAAGNAPDADVAVIIFATEAGRANASGFGDGLGATSNLPQVHLARTDDARTLTHELGHAVFGLGDEYVEVEECYPGSAFAYATIDLVRQPNLTRDPTGAKWRELHDGARQGGARHACGIYRPTDDCRMRRAAGDAFCPVCAHRIDTVLRLRREPGTNDGPPRCGLALDQPPAALGGLVHLAGVAEDLNGVASFVVALDGSPLHAGTGPPPDGAPWTVWAEGMPLDTREVAAGAHRLTFQATDLLGSECRAELEVTVVARPRNEAALSSVGVIGWRTVDGAGAPPP